MFCNTFATKIISLKNVANYAVKSLDISLCRRFVFTENKHFYGKIKIHLQQKKRLSLL